MRRLETESEGFKRREQAAAQARAEILRLAQSQRDKLATSFGDLLGDGGPSSETADEMIQAIREWRDTNPTGVNTSQTGKLIFDEGMKVYGNRRRTIS